MSQSNDFKVLLDQVVLYRPSSIEMSSQTLAALRHDPIDLLPHIEIDDGLALYQVRLIGTRDDRP